MSPVPPQRPRIDQHGVIRSFDAHARSYDRMVGANRGYHEHLRMSARRMGLAGRGTGLRLLDLGCGTGASTAALLDTAPDAEIIAVDASAEMIAVARRKSWPARVTFMQGNADDLEQAKLTGPFDGILAAYLLRNLPDPDASLKRMLELLRPGAPLAVHEYSVADSPRARARWTTVCWGVIIPMGRVRAGSADLYRYLWRSVLAFDGAETIKRRMAAAGFEDVREQTVPGWQQHIVHTFLGRRPVAPPRTSLAKAGPAEAADAATPPAGIDPGAQA